MISSDTQNLLARILLALAEGERSVEDARKEISIEDSYDIQAIFKVLDNLDIEIFNLLFSSLH